MPPPSDAAPPGSASASPDARRRRRRRRSRAEPIHISRRAFFLGALGTVGALMVGWTLMPPRQRLLTAQPLPVRDGQHAFNGWVRIGSDDSVVVCLPRSEMGQGVATTLPMLLADELDADWGRVRTEPAPVDPIFYNQAVVVDGLPFHPDDEGWIKHAAGWMTAKAMREFGLMATGGSTSIKDLWLPMRLAGASARTMLVASAARWWGVLPEECTVVRGVVAHPPTGRSARFGELIERVAAWKAPEPTDVPLKAPHQFTLIGRPVPRAEAAAKHDGSARFGLDTVADDLLYATVLMCPTLGGSVARVETRAAEALPGVRKVVVVPGLRGGTGGVAVVSDQPWQCLAAVRALQVEWQHGPAAALSSADIDRQLQAALDRGPGDSLASRGQAGRAVDLAQRLVQAEYHAPLLAHATLEPQNCTVLYRADTRRATVWAPTQVPGLARWAAARALGLDEDHVELRVTLLGGGFGRRLEVDVVAQAAAVARQVPGVPVQTFWSREQDTTHDLYRPPCSARWRAGLDAQGRLVGLQAVSAGPSVVHQFLDRQWGLPAAGPDKTTLEGAFDQPYEVPAIEVSHRIVPLPVPVGFWRSVGHSHQAFFKESFLDECAHAAHQDPVRFRAGLLAGHPRHRAVLQQVAERAGWGRPPAAAPDGAPCALGVALHQSFGSIVAQVARVSVDPADRRQWRVHEVWAVADCGTVVNPLLAAQQIEGGIVFGLSAARHGEITLAKGQVQQTNFHQQPLLRMSECPAIHTHLMPSSAPPEGLGEPGTPPIAPAVANALFTLTGQRLRRLPLRLA